MKKGICLLLVLMLLSGCASEPVYETLGDVWENTEPVAAPGQIELALTDEAQMEAMESSDGAKVYRYGISEIRTEILTSGDLAATLSRITGMDCDMLTVIQREQDGMAIYETAWSVMGDEGMTLARAMVADDGAYHYCVSVIIPEEQAQQVSQVFQTIIDSVSITDTAQ